MTKQGHKLIQIGGMPDHAYSDRTKAYAGPLYTRGEAQSKFFALREQEKAASGPLLLARGVRGLLGLPFATRQSDSLHPNTG